MIEIMKIQYAWIRLGKTEVYVGDIEENKDEFAIIQQIEAMELGWA